MSIQTPGPIPDLAARPLTGPMTPELLALMREWVEHQWHDPIGQRVCRELLAEVDRLRNRLACLDRARREGED